MSTFITFEGIEGCGKTTQIRLLGEELANSGLKVLVTREPGGCPVADQIRAILLDAANSSMTPLTELLLYAAARAQHVGEVIQPALTAGIIVLCDRFTDATIAYQGNGRSLDLELIAQLNRIAAARRPDLTLLLDCPVETGLARAMDRIGAAGNGQPREERFEKESLDFHRRVRDGYLRLAAAEPDRFVIVDAAADVTTIAARIRSAVLARLPG